MARTNEHHREWDPESIWRVTWFCDGQRYDFEVQAPNAFFARMFVRHRVEEQKLFSLNRAEYIGAERIE